MGIETFLKEEERIWPPQQSDLWNHLLNYFPFTQYIVTKGYMAGLKNPDFVRKLRESGSAIQLDQMIDSGHKEYAVAEHNVKMMVNSYEARHGTKISQNDLDEYLLDLSKRILAKARDIDIDDNKPADPDDIDSLKEWETKRLLLAIREFYEANRLRTQQ